MLEPYAYIYDFIWTMVNKYALLPFAINSSNATVTCDVTGEQHQTGKH